MNGDVKWYSKEKGYGFIIGEDNNEYFLHSSKIENREELTKGSKVTFEVLNTDKGVQAKNVMLVN